MAHTETRVIAKVIVVDAHDQILLLQRSASDSRRPLQWDIPGGHVDADELIEQTAVRETAEETGLTISMEQLQLISTRTQMVKLELNVNWLFFYG